MNAIEHRRFIDAQDIAIDALKECAKLRRSNFVLRCALHVCRRRLAPLRPMVDPTLGRRLV